MTEQTYLLMHRHINGYGRLFGGQLMQWIDELAGIVSMRHAGGRITTASIDNLNFKAGAYLNDTIVLIGRITYVGRTSMEVRVDTYVEDLEGMRRVINRAYVVMVAIDESLRARVKRQSGKQDRNAMHSANRDAEKVFRRKRTEAGL